MRKRCWKQTKNAYSETACQWRQLATSVVWLRSLLRTHGVWTFSRRLEQEMEWIHEQVLAGPIIVQNYSLVCKGFTRWVVSDKFSKPKNEELGPFDEQIIIAAHGNISKILLKSGQLCDGLLHDAVIDAGRDEVVAVEARQYVLRLKLGRATLYRTTWVEMKKKTGRVVTIVVNVLSEKSVCNVGKIAWNEL